MIPENRIPTHPGEVLLEELLKPMGITQKRLAEHMGVSVQRVNEIVRGKRGVTAQTAWLLQRDFWDYAQFLGKLAEFSRLG